MVVSSGRFGAEGAGVESAMGAVGTAIGAVGTSSTSKFGFLASIAATIKISAINLQSAIVKIAHGRFSKH